MYYKKCSKCNKLYSLEEIEKHYLHTNNNICCKDGYLEDIDKDFSCHDCYYCSESEGWFNSDPDPLCELLDDWILDNMDENCRHRDCPLTSKNSLEN
jgi:hypothetical protein